MITVTLQEAKAKLNHLVDQAKLGEQVVLMRGSKVVATILPISEKDLELTSKLTDTQAAHFWQEIASQEKRSFSSIKSSLDFFKKS